jgi:hypothetical protein
MRIDQLDLLLFRHRVGDVAGDVEKDLSRRERACAFDAIEEPGSTFEQGLEGRPVEGHGRSVTSRPRRG